MGFKDTEVKKQLEKIKGPKKKTIFLLLLDSNKKRDSNVDLNKSTEHSLAMQVNNTDGDPWLNDDGQHSRVLPSSNGTEQY